MADPAKPAPAPAPPAASPPAPAADSTGELRPVAFSPQLTPGARRVIIGSVAATTAAACWVLWPFRTPLFLAVVMAAALFPLHIRLESRLKGRAALSAALITLALFAALAVPVASVFTFVAQEVTRGLAWLREVLGVAAVGDVSFSKLPPHVQEFIERALAALHISREQLRDWASKGVDWAQGATKSALGASAQLVGGTALMLVTLYVLLLDGRQALRYLKGMSPLPRAQTEELIAEFRNVTSAAVIGTTVTAMVQAVLATLAYLAAGVPHPFFLGVATLLASFIPAVGTMLVWVPAAGVLVVQGRTTAAIVMAIWCLVVVGGSDNVIKPLLMRGRVAMHGGLVLLSLLGGLATFGILGIILGPLVMSFLVALLRIYRRDYLERVG